MKTHQAERWSFIKKWLNEHSHIDALNTDFHESFHLKFPQYKRIECFWGSQTVKIAMTDLSEMYHCGIISRGRISLGCNWQPGFPKWVYVYSLS